MFFDRLSAGGDSWRAALRADVTRVVERLAWDNVRVLRPLLGERKKEIAELRQRLAEKEAEVAALKQRLAEAGKGVAIGNGRC